MGRRATKKFNGRAFIRDFMCRQVRASHVLYRVSDEHGKFWWKPFPVKPPLVGWVVGATYLQTGLRTPGDLPGEWGEGDPPGFAETGSRVLAYLVTRWPTVKPHRVPPEAVEVLSEPVTPYLWSESEREMVAEEASLYPRDEKGRFVSGPPLPLPLSEKEDQ